MGIATGDYGVSSLSRMRIDMDIATTAMPGTRPTRAQRLRPTGHRDAATLRQNSSPLVGNCSPPIQTSKGSDLLLPMAKARWRFTPLRRNRSRLRNI